MHFNFQWYTYCCNTLLQLINSFVFNQFTFSWKSINTFSIAQYIKKPKLNCTTQIYFLFQLWYIFFWHDTLRERCILCLCIIVYAYYSGKLQIKFLCFCGKYIVYIYYIGSNFLYAPMLLCLLLTTPTLRLKHIVDMCNVV